MKSYILIKKGVYIQDILGVFSSENKAREAFDNLYSLEKSKEVNRKHNDFDKHHDFYIVVFDFDKIDNVDSVEHIELTYEEIVGTVW